MRNRIIHTFSLFTFFSTLAFAAGCAGTKKEVVYVAADRRIESCTNRWGFASKAVPDAVFAEMLLKLEELKELKKERKVDARISAGKN